MRYSEIGQLDKPLFGGHKKCGHCEERSDVAIPLGFPKVLGDRHTSVRTGSR